MLLAGLGSSSLAALAGCSREDSSSSETPSADDGDTDSRRLSFDPTQQAQLTAEQWEADSFGREVAISKSGATAIVTAPEEKLTTAIH